MAHLTEKENYLMCLRGEQPEWIPHVSMDPAIPGPSAGVGPSITARKVDADGRMWDIWGVELITSKEAAGGMIPKTWDFLLDDVTKWRDVIKAPDLTGVDWEQMAKHDLEKAAKFIDRENQAVTYGASSGFFQNLMAFMGFTEGLCALFEEPEECEALFDYICDFQVEVIKNSIDYPAIGRATAEAVASGECEKGIVLCTTGIGISIVANKVKGVRAALCNDCTSARLTRMHNDANVLALGGGVIGPNLALDIVDIFFSTEFSGEEKHVRRLSQIAGMEDEIYS